MVVDHLEEVVCDLVVDGPWQGGSAQTAVVCAVDEGERRSYFCRDTAYLELLWEAEKRGVLKGLRLEGRQVSVLLPMYWDGWPEEW
ncbi:hypothetical protein [Wenjunlia tyrosinilytica]|uniref:Uncharacterized protein n=1 Tax=Wenjunlia tyrosinilytica TaxID=1544741 RepID=A0A918E2L2_9ACTN|nr:hypothetical protein [Wenjunlia tyrosinilytica]GGO99842.1 hypothetical protein GCM10012280_67220 [Wenjunlia tyrosinilytica]